VDEPLVRAFELEKACYEVRYEANNRPDWVWLPLEALERLAAVDAK
jgi:maltokinase